MEDNEEFKPTKSIIVNNKILHWKANLKNQKFSYRCTNQKVCNSIFYFSQQDFLAHSLSPLFNLIPLKIITGHINTCLGIKNFDSLDSKTNINDSIHMPGISNVENTNINNVSTGIERLIEINCFNPLI